MAEALKLSYELSGILAGGTIDRVTWRGQVFTTEDAFTLSSVSILCNREGDVPTVIVEVYGVAAGIPDIGSGALATGSFDGNTLVSDPDTEWKNVPLTGSPTLDGQYAFVVYYADDSDSTDINLMYNFLGSYEGGDHVRSYNGGVEWAAQSGTVNFRIYTSDVSVEVPDVVGLTLAAATTDIEAVGLTVASSLLYSESVTEGLVISQDPAAESEVDAGSEVDLVVSAGETPPGWPTVRPAAYDETKLWDEETAAWYAATTNTGKQRIAQAGGRIKNNLIALSDDGKVYFGEI